MYLLVFHPFKQNLFLHSVFLKECNWLVLYIKSKRTKACREMCFGDIQSHLTWGAVNTHPVKFPEFLVFCGCLLP